MARLVVVAVFLIISPAVGVPSHRSPSGLGHLSRWKPSSTFLQLPSGARSIPKGDSQWDEVFSLVQRFIGAAKCLLSLPPHIYGPEFIRPDATYKPYWTWNIYLIKDLFRLDLDIYQILKRFNSSSATNAGGISRAFMALDSYLTDVESSSLLALKVFLDKDPVTNDNTSPYVDLTSHPVLIYRLLRRFAMDLNSLLVQLGEVDDEMVFTILRISSDAIPPEAMLPTKEDLDDMLWNLIQCQTENLLSTYSVAKGQLGPVSTAVGVDSLQALEIGTFFVKNQIFDTGIQWLHVALKKFHLDTFVAQHYPQIGGFIREIMEMAVVEHNNLLQECGPNDMDLFTVPVKLPFQPSRYIQTVYRLNPEMNAENLMDTRFQRVCAGDNLQWKESRGIAVCWLEQGRMEGDWYIRLSPFKFELVNVYPPVFQVYGVMSDQLIATIKRAAYGKLERRVEPSLRMPMDRKIPRTGGSARLHAPFLKPLTRRLELITGRKLNDEYYAAQYIPGQYFDLHLDGNLVDTKARETETDFRLATVIGYLDDMPVGGKTGFPVLGFAVTPVRGSVVLWYNRDMHGREDHLLWHGGCPVALGVKWTITKYAYTVDNPVFATCNA